jgi:amino acid adenylation domain-containing protein
MQVGMLFQSLLAEGSERSGYDIEQIGITLPEALQPDALARAWTLVVRRHSALTASFHWQDLPAPEQRPEPDLVVPVEFLDWSELSADAGAAARGEFLQRDRRRGFDLRKAPLLRVTVLTFGPQQTELVWTVHHILIDGRSFAPVLLEVFAVYDTLLRGDTPILSRPPRPYGDYIDWLSRQDWHASLPFWKTLLQGKHAPTPLPLAEPATRSLPGSGCGEVVRRLDDSLAGALRSFARASNTRISTLVQAAFGLVLSCLTCDEDVLFGVTRSSRRAALGGEAEAMIGLFINTLPVRMRIDHSQTISDLLASVAAEASALRAHEHTPLVEVQGQSDMPRGTALFDTLLMYDNRELNRSLRAADPRWHSRSVSVHEQPGPSLTVILVDDEEMEIRILYDRRRFRETVAERIAHYLASALAELPVRTLVGELDIIPPTERQRLLYAWNDTERVFAHDQRIHEPFEQRVAQQPDAIAVAMGGVQLSYAELDRQANRIANAVRARGALPGQYVGICLSRSPTLVAALLAAAKAGVPYVPLDPDYPRERLDFMLDDTHAALVITEQRYQALFNTLVLLVDGADVDAATDAALACSAAATDPCYAIYTSGSTGRPKGVVLTHRAVINTLDWVSRTFEVGPGDRLLFVTSPCFDLSVYDTFGTLGAGATVVVASSERMKDPHALAQALVDERISIWDSAPAALQRLSAFFPPAGADHLRLIMLSGDWIPLALASTVQRAFPKARIVSLGGATEAAIWSNWFPLDEIDPRWASVPYGRPIQNARYHVLDRRMRLTPLGVPGDLYIGGVCLAQGYLARPELTAERFVADPFRPNERLYMTGDVARYFDDGELEFLGRADFQVKIRGHRVELGEVEIELNALPSVREALCSAYVDASGQKSLVAYVVPHAGAALDERDIKQRLGAKLPGFMVPSQVLFLPALPLSANGKVDRKALPSPTGRALPSGYVAPRNELERRMASIWQDVLQCERIGVTDDFFALGGQSLLAVMLVSRVERELGERIPLSRVLERPNIEALVESMRQPIAVCAPRHLVTLNSQGTRPPLVLISGIGGFGFMFQGLCSRLGDRQPVHVLHAVGAEDESEGYEHSIEAVASIYAGQVTAVCPDGPLIIGGYSFGVLVALELALRLQRAGREVPLLISFDGFAPGHPKLLPVTERALMHLRQFRRRGPRARVEYVRERLNNLKKRLRGVTDEDATSPLDSLDAATDRRLRNVAAGLWQARDRYRPNELANCDVLLFKASVPFDWSGTWFEPLYGWREFVRGRVESTIIPGGHLELFRPENHPLMARALSVRLAELEETDPGYRSNG